MTLMRFFGALLLCAGALIAFVCGACTLIFLGPDIGSRFDGSVIFVLLVGGIPTVLGCLTMAGGIALIWFGGKPRPTR